MIDIYNDKPFNFVSREFICIRGQTQKKSFRCVWRWRDSSRQ